MKGVNTAKQIKHCFIASDDCHAMPEVKQALMNHNISCAVHTLTKPIQRGSNTTWCY